MNTPLSPVFSMLLKKQYIIVYKYVKRLNNNYISLPYARRSKKLIFTTNPHWAKIILTNQRWNQLATWRRKFTELSPSHKKQITGMKCKKDGVNQHANRCKPFHQKNTMFSVGTCMTASFKPQEWSIYKKQKQRSVPKGNFLS